MKTLQNLSAITLVLALAACGSSPTDRTVSGAGIGAGAGAIGGALIGVNPVGAALVGGAVGAGTGATLWYLNRDKAPTAQGVTVHPYLGLGSVGAVGSF